MHFHYNYTRPRKRLFFFFSDVAKADGALLNHCVSETARTVSETAETASGPLSNWSRESGFRKERSNEGVSRRSNGAAPMNHYTFVYPLIYFGALGVRGNTKGEWCLKASNVKAKQDR